MDAPEGTPSSAYPRGQPGGSHGPIAPSREQIVPTLVTQYLPLFKRSLWQSSRRVLQ